MKKDTYNSNVPLGTIVAFALSKKNIPSGWLLCDGEEIPANYDELITALGQNNTPKLSGRTLVSAGDADSGTYYNLGQKGGEETHTLSVNEMPSHDHGYMYVTPLGYEDSDHDYYSGSYWAPKDIQSATDKTGGDAPHNNMQPFYTVNYIIKAI